MSNEVALAEQWSPEKVQLIKDTVAVGATDLELALFSEICKKKGLDPFSRQIHFIKRKRWNAQTKQQEEFGVIQTGIDGYRTIAERTGKYAGQDKPEFDEKANPKDPNGKLWPIKATVTVYKLVAGQKCAFSGEARLSEYAQYTTDKNTKKQVLNSMWAKMPYSQLAKCAEALALRKAFPQDLSGIYTNEEMGQADNDQNPSQTKLLNASVSEAKPKNEQPVDQEPKNITQPATASEEELQDPNEVFNQPDVEQGGQKEVVKTVPVEYKSEAGRKMAEAMGVPAKPVEEKEITADDLTVEEIFDK